MIALVFDQLNIRLRHTLTKGEKKAYINAELCLMKRKATAGLPHARTKFDELQETHVILSEVVHHVGAFLPFHRYLMWAHEYLLRTECKYTGTQPYWQEQADAGNFLGSPLLDPDTGFGGNGRAGDGCITNGPFANYVNPLGPGYNVSDHCIYRRVDETVSLRAGQQFVDECMAFNTFEQAWPCMEFWPHRAGHGGVNGLVSLSSP
ncbi:Di-copper centre-containing protein [Sporormia fimetaria CBS 119925]|uniref:Di-copper centre-containing protein n=1 Tax=Sporormia fimetaria CBS 119925 TaxID=1340428 RepID=A0A6A6UZT3_9PLEO|nr:Di-copper centre-containing protein [Sporormia fimetaria CBS 119925]